VVFIAVPFMIYIFAYPNAIQTYETMNTFAKTNMKNFRKES